MKTIGITVLKLSLFPTFVCLLLSHIMIRQMDLVGLELLTFFVGFAFAVFICIVLFHVYLVLCETAVWKKMPKPNVKRFFMRAKKENKDLPPGSHRQNVILQVSTETTIDLSMCEPLLEQ